MKRLRRPRWFFMLVSTMRGWWIYPCVNCGRWWTAWEWELDGYPTTGMPGWCPWDFGLCTECATATADELREIKPDWLAAQLDAYADRYRREWMRQRMDGEDDRDRTSQT
jgi:hypothetical protein